MRKKGEHIKPLIRYTIIVQTGSTKPKGRQNELQKSSTRARHSRNHRGFSACTFKKHHLLQ
jgi:hypothetical protein